MKKRKLSFRHLLLSLFSIIVCSFCIYTYSYNYIYESISLSTNKVAVIEYGTAIYDLKKFVKKVEGDIVSVRSDVDSSEVGMHEVVFVLKKNGVVKEIPLEVEVKDTNAPIIEIISDSITIKQGEIPDIFGNIKSVVDSVDGTIEFSSNFDNDKVNYYTIESTVDANVVGNYPVKIIAVDTNGNMSIKEFAVIVERNSVADRAVKLAYSLLGRPYVLGTNGPTSFDCSGLVQYVYSQVGVRVSRSSSTQLYDGIGVSYSNILPGDIVSWGYTADRATHSGIYVGNGKMIHAANPSQGVILSDISSWDRGSAENVIAVRRVS